jgi:hypothetical protein
MYIGEKRREKWGNKDIHIPRLGVEAESDIAIQIEKKRDQGQRNSDHQNLVRITDA